MLFSLEDLGFRPRGEAGPFAASGALDWPNGALPCNAAGGNFSEAYIHGFNLIAEAARQLRGESTAQVEGAEVCRDRRRKRQPDERGDLGSELR